jgi:cytochrome c biogenesis protein ResB
VIIIASVIGAVIPQQRSPDEYLSCFGAVPASLLISLHLSDVFHAPWFTLLLILFFINILTCTIQRLLSHRVRSASLFTHAALLLILCGAATSSLISQRGVLFLARGQSADKYLSPGGVKQLGFTIHLDDFAVIPGETPSAMPDFRSDVTIRENEKEPVRSAIIVNRPLTFKGYSFYQSFYDPVAGAWTGIEVVRDPGVPFMYAGFALLNVGILLMVGSKLKGRILHALH